jgi:hypothetical protein
MNFFSVFTTKAYLKSKNFWLSLSYIIFFITLLITPSILFFNITIFEINESIFQSFGKNISNYPLLQSKVNELLPWVVVCLTALLIIIGNTIFYFFTFNDDLIDEKFKTKKYWFTCITFMFLLWITFSAIYLIRFVFCYSEIRTILDFNNISKYSDLQLSKQVNEAFDHFIILVEFYTIITISIFILIDFFNILAKHHQLINVKQSLYLDRNNSELQFAYRKIMIQKVYVTNQLSLIDTPVLIGLLLVYLFTLQVTTSNAFNSELKYLFVSGGMGMHVIMSQVIFLILNVRYKLSEYRISNTERNNIDLIFTDDVEPIIEIKPKKETVIPENKLDKIYFN